MVFSYAEASTIDSFCVSDFDQSIGYRLEDAVELSASKIFLSSNLEKFTHY